MTYPIRGLLTAIIVASLCAVVSGAGAHNITAALNTLTEESESPIAALGYAVPYAFANVLLTILGSVIIHMM